MRRVILFSAAMLVGCGSSEPADDPVATDAAGEVALDTGGAIVDTGAAADSTTPDSARPAEDANADVVIFPVEDTGPPPACGVPAGTTATASTNAANAGQAFDGSLTTGWTTGLSTGTLKLTFPSSVRFDRVRIYARSITGTPTGTFTLTGRLPKTTVPLGKISGGLTTTAKWLPEAAFPAGAYDGLDILASAASAIVEVYLYDSTGGCTPP